MEIPKIFIPENEKEINPNKIKPQTLSLEELILESINGISCDEKVLSRLISSSLSNDYYSYLGIDASRINRIAVAKYDNGGSQSILLMEYKQEKELFNSLEKIYEGGSEYLDQWYKASIRFAERFLYKNNIAVYINGNEEFTKQAVEQYKKLGFEYGKE